MKLSCDYYQLKLKVDCVMRCKLRKLYIKCLWVNQQGIACTHSNKGHVWSREEYGVGRAALRFYYTWQGNCAWQDFRFIEILQVIRCIVCRSKHWIIKKQKKKQNSLLKEPKWHEKSQKSIWLSVLVLTGAESGRRTNQARRAALRSCEIQLIDTPIILLCIQCGSNDCERNRVIIVFEH